MKAKKVLAITLTAAMVLGCGITALADDTSATTTGAGASEGHVDKEVLNFVLPVVPEGETPFAYTMDPERLIQETSGGKYDTGTTFPEEEGDTGVYFQTGDKTYANESNAFYAVNKSSVDVTLTVEVQSTAGSNDIASTSDKAALVTAATDSSPAVPKLYLGLKVGEDEQAISTTKATIKKVIEGSDDNYEVAVVEGTSGKGYEYKIKDDATDWKAIKISAVGAVGNAAIADNTTAPSISVTWSYAKAVTADGVKATDVETYTETPAEPAAPATPTAAITKGQAVTLTLAGNTTSGKTVKSVSVVGSAGTEMVANAARYTYTAGASSSTLTLDATWSNNNYDALGDTTNGTVTYSDDSTEAFILTK